MKTSSSAGMAASLSRLSEQLRKPVFEKVETGCKLATLGPTRNVPGSVDKPSPFSDARGSVPPRRARVCAALFCCVIILSSFCLRASAQSYSIDWYKVAGGGGTSTGGYYSVSGTIGQHDAGGPMTGGNYSLVGGFWSLISLVQASGAPVLNISHSGNTVTVYWQNVTGWSLQQNSSLTAPSGWSASSGVMTSNGTNYSIVITPTGNLFFRLSKP